MNKKMFAVPVAALMISSFMLAPRALASDDQPSDRKKDCEMTFTLSGWSIGYKTAKGEGTITCSNGQSAKVILKVKGGGLTAGKSRIVDGKGQFSGVRSIEDVFGSYATGSAHAGVVKSAMVEVMTKGEVSLALSGTGEGVDLGIDFGKFTIKRAR